MRILRVSVAAAAIAVMASAAVAQSPSAAPPPPAGTVSPAAGNPPEVGSPLLRATNVGLDKVAADGASTRTVRAAPCSVAARETDGSTTCVGIPGPVRSIDYPEGTTTGMAR
jgi:hypothetical protein